MDDAIKSSYEAKAAFFDDQVCSQWASEPYSREEEQKLEHLFEVTGSLLGLRLLEPGCGTGRLTAILAQKVGPAGKVVAIDISPGMVAEARRRVAVFSNAEILMGTAEAQVETIGKFHMVICHQVFPHFEDPRSALGKLTQMLHPGGRIVISHFMSSAQINDVHRKTHAAVAHDMIPPMERLQQWCRQLDLVIEKEQDGDDGYLFCARLI